MPETLTDLAYRHIHARLLSGDLRPGTRLSNRALAKEISISFTPVREALNRLVSEGLLEYRRGIGVFVPVATRREIEDLYELRETLECAAAAKVSGHVPGGALDEMVALMDQMEELGVLIGQSAKGEPDRALLERFWIADMSFHVALVRAAGNRLALEAIQGLARMSAIISHNFEMGPRRQVTRTLEEHRRILDSLRHGDIEAVRATMAEHIRVGQQLTLAAYDRHYMSGESGILKGPHKSPVGAERDGKKEVLESP